MKIHTLAIVLVVALALAAGPVLTHPALAKEPDRLDNKVLISGVPQGWAIQVAQPDAEFPRGPGNLPDNTGLVMAYAPLGRPSQVFLWDKTSNAYYLIATIAPVTTWPDTALSVPVQYAQGAPYRGLAAPIQPNPGYVTPYYPASPSYAQPGYVTPYVPANPSLAQPGQQYVVQSGDTLGAIARRFGTTISAIAALNNIANPNLIVTGQVLAIP
jgi:nucleoid-associated protein YgaU